MWYAGALHLRNAGDGVPYEYRKTKSAPLGAPNRFPRGWCSAQRIQNPMIAGGNHTTIPSCHGVALKSRPMTDEECGRQPIEFGHLKTSTCVRTTTCE